MGWDSDCIGTQKSHPIGISEKVKHIASIRPSNVDKKKYEGQDKVWLANYVDVYKRQDY